MRKIPVLWRYVSCASVKKAVKIDAEGDMVHGVDPTNPDWLVAIDADASDMILVEHGKIKYCIPTCSDFGELLHECYDITEHVKDCLEVNQDG